MNIFRTDQQVDSMDARKLSSMYIPLWGIFIFGLLTILSKLFLSLSFLRFSPHFYYILLLPLSAINCESLGP